MSTAANSPRTHQTIRLAPGKHSSPEHGVCVMELASMLAGERFSDHPRSVSPVIATFLRGYNDRVDDVRRQDLYSFAAACVGTRGTRALERRRAEACRCWLEAHAPETRRSRLMSFLRGAAGGRTAAPAAASRFAAASRERHGEALAFVESLIDLGRRSPFRAPAFPPAELPQTPDRVR